MDDDVLMTIIAEALGEGPEGMRRVGETILNRAAIRGLTPTEVVRQPHQYTGYFVPGPAAREAQRDPRVISAAEAAWELARRPGDPTGGADHYHAAYANPGWADSMPSTGSFGRHTFYASRPVPVEALAALLTPSAPEPAGRLQRQIAYESAGMRPDLSAPPALIDDTFSALPNTGASRRTIADMFAPTEVTPRLDATGTRVALPSATADLRMQSGIFPKGHQQAVAPKTASQDWIANLIASVVSPQRAETRSVNSNTPQTFAGQDRAPQATTVGKPPTTRVVQTVPVVPTRSKIDGVQAMPAFSDIAAMFGSKAKQPTGSVNNGKSQDRLPMSTKTSATPPALFGGIDPRLAGLGPSAPKPRPAGEAVIARAPKPATRTVTEKQLNPAWVAAQSRVDPIGEMPSWDEFVKTVGPPKPAAPMPPKFITVTRQVQVTQPKPPRITVSGARPIQPEPQRAQAQPNSGGNQSTWSPWGPADNLTKPTSQLRPGDRAYNPDTNSWERKAPAPSKR